MRRDEVPAERVRASRVAVVGGSIAGCATAVALRRRGAQVTIFERSASELRDRGLGIGMLVSQWREFADAGYLDPDVPPVPWSERRWIVRDPAAGPWGRVLWRQPTTLSTHHWGVVWRSLRDRLPDDVAWTNATVLGVHDGDDGPEVRTSAGDARFDAVVGADGYRSRVRSAVGVGRPVYAGYGLWRGSYPAARTPAAGDRIGDRGITLVYPGGHGVLYRIPGLPGDPPLINWAFYHARAAHGPTQARPARDAATRDGPARGRPTRDAPGSLPPGSFDAHRSAALHAFADAHLPPGWADVVRRTRREELALQPVYDVLAPHYARGRLLLAGDAGALARPHTGAGVAKALVDAMTLERACAADDRWDAVVEGYDRERTRDTAATVALGRRLGDHQVTHAPDWAAMGPDDFERWFAATLAG